MQDFDIDAWVEARKARWAEIVAMGRDVNNYNIQEMLGMDDDEYAAYVAKENSGNN